MEEGGIRVSIYQSKEKNRFFSLARIGIFVVGVLLPRLMVRLFICRLPGMIQILTGSVEAAEILGGLKRAALKPSWLVPLVFALCISLFPFGKKHSGKHVGHTGRVTGKKIATHVAFGLTVLILFAVTLALTLAFTRINGVRVWVVVKVLYPLLKNGALAGAL